MDNKIERIISFDYLRAMAAFSVVFLHTSYTNHVVNQINVINRYAVPCFIMMSIYLLGFKVMKSKLNFSQKMQLVKNFVLKIAIHYVFWNTLYLIFQFLKYQMTGQVFELDFYKIFFGTASIQLWFLPAIIVWYSFMVFYYGVKNQLLDVLFVIFFFILAQLLIEKEVFENHVWKLFFRNTGFIFCGKLIYNNIHYLKKIPSYVYAVLAVLVYVIGLNINRFTVFNFVLPEVMFSVFIFIFFLTVKLKSSELISSISSNSFGIYLNHFAVYQTIILLQSMLGVNNTGVLVTTLNIIFTFVLSYLLSSLFKKNKILSRVV